MTISTVTDQCLRVGIANVENTVDIRKWLNCIQKNVQPCPWSW